MGWELKCNNCGVATLEEKRFGGETYNVCPFCGSVYLVIRGK